MWERRRLGSASGHARWHQDPTPPGNGLSGDLGWGVREEDLGSDGPQGSCHRSRQLERVPSLWLSTCDVSGERGTLTLHCWGDWRWSDLSGGRLAMQMKVLEMCVLRPSNSTAKGFSQVNRYIGGAIRGFLFV